MTVLPSPRKQQSAAPPPGQLLSEAPDSLALVLDLIRHGATRTRPELVHRLGLGRKVVTQRVQELIDAGLVEEGELAPSTGGRAARELRFRAEAGHVLVAEISATKITTGVSDLASRLLTDRQEPTHEDSDPERLLSRVETLFDELISARPTGSPTIWGIGIGVLGPVDAVTGRPVECPMLPRWANYPVRDRLAARYQLPVWVENEANLMALGEFRAGVAQGHLDMAFVKIGSGIGAGIISNGQLHRGAHGMAGEIGHTIVVDDTSTRCWCGNPGCLTSWASGSALAWFATEAADQGHSSQLAGRLANHQLTAQDVAAAAAAGDPTSVRLLDRAGELVGQVVAGVVNSHNPSMVVIGGGVAGAGDAFLAAIKRSVYQRSFPMTTRDLAVTRSQLGARAGLIGASVMVADAVMSRSWLGRWIERGTPWDQHARQATEPGTDSMTMV